MLVRTDDPSSLATIRSSIFETLLIFAFGLQFETIFLKPDLNIGETVASGSINTPIERDLLKMILRGLRIPIPTPSQSKFLIAYSSQNQ